MATVRLQLRLIPAVCPSYPPNRHLTTFAGLRVAQKLLLNLTELTCSQTLMLAHFTMTTDVHFRPLYASGLLG